MWLELLLLLAVYLLLLWFVVAFRQRLRMWLASEGRPQPKRKRPSHRCPFPTKRLAT
jgi:hypothetical protein